MRLRRALFTAADIDRNDNLTLIEFELLTLPAQTGWTDRNHDGHIQPSELRESLVQAFSRGPMRIATLLYPPSKPPT